MTIQSNNADSFQYGDQKVGKIYKQKRSIGRDLGLGKKLDIEMYQHHSVVHVSESDQNILAIGFNPQNSDNNKGSNKSGSKKENEKDTLEPTRRNGIYQFSDFKDTDKQKPKHFKVGTYIQTDLFAEPSHTTSGMKKNKKYILHEQDLELLEQMLSDKSPHIDAILIAWGAAGKATLAKKFNTKYKERLLKDLNDVKDRIYYLSGNNTHRNPYTCYAASYSNCRGSLKKLGEKSLSDFM